MKNATDQVEQLETELQKPRKYMTAQEMERWRNEKALPAALYLVRNLPLLTKWQGSIDIDPTSPYEENVQSYLNLKRKKFKDTKINGIILVMDGWPNPKDHRNCLVVAGEGPLFEALGTKVIEDGFANYEIKTRVLKKVCRVVSGETLNVKGVHYHPWPFLIKGPARRTAKETMREQLTADHGAHDPRFEKAPLYYYRLHYRQGSHIWVAALADDVAALTNRKVRL